MGKISDEIIKEDEIEHIREDIRHTEAEISETLHAMEHKFTPAHLKEELKEKLHPAAVIGTVTTALRRKSVQAALMGGGALWFIVRQRKKHPRPPLGKGAAAVETLKEKVKREPVKTVKRTVNLGRIAVALGSIGMMFLRRRRGTYPGGHGGHPAGLA